MKHRFPPEFLKKYEVKKELGRGGMGVVLQCMQKNLNRQVAVKVLHPLEDDPSSKARFRREAKLLCSMRHKNIVKIFDYGFASGMQYIVQELLPGKAFDVVLTGPLPLARIYMYGQQICEGLAYAHERKIIHRDLKPGNIFLCPDDIIKILDFGLAFCEDQTTRLTETGTIVGTPNYMAPEQMTTTNVDEAADLYALGAIIYYMIAGLNPYDHARNFEELMSLKLCGSHRPLCAMGVQPISIDLEELIEELLHPDPDKRPASANEVRERLLSIQKGKAQLRPKQETLATEPAIEEATAQRTSPRSWSHFFAVIVSISLVLLFLSLNAKTPAVKECRFLERGLHESSLTFHLRAKANQHCRLICSVNDPSNEESFAPIVLSSSDQWNCTIGQLMPNKNYEIKLSLRHEGKIKDTKSFTIKTKKWEAIKVIEGPRLYYPATAHKDKLFLVDTSGHIYCYTLSNFKLMWRRTKDTSLGGLLAGKDKIILGEKGRHLVQALDPQSGQTIWKCTIPDEADEKLLRSKELIFVRVKKSGIFCINVKDGKILWKSSQYARPPWVTAGKYLLHNVEDFDVPRTVTRDWSTGKVIDRQTNPKFIARTDYAPFANRLYFVSEQNTIMMNIAKKQPKPIFQPVGIAMILAASKNHLAYRSHRPNLLALHELPSGEQIWQVALSKSWDKNESMILDQGLLYHVHPQIGLEVYCSYRGAKLYSSQKSTVGQFGLIKTPQGVLFGYGKRAIHLLPHPKNWPPEHNYLP